MDAVELIRRFHSPEVLIYADPPYLLSTRKGKRQYGHEMTEAEHVELMGVLKEKRGTPGSRRVRPGMEQTDHSP